MKFKKAISVFLAVIAVASTCIVTASAKTARTNTYYVYQEMSYGELTLTSKTLVSLTYCELARAGKIVKANYVATANGKLTSLSAQAGGNYNTNSFNRCTDSSSNYAETSISAQNGVSLKSAKSYHKVRISSYVTWDSAQCEGNTNGYDIPYIVL